MLAARRSPSAPSARLESTIAAKASSSPAQPGHSRTSESRMVPTAMACVVPSRVALSVLPNATVLRRMGATSTMRNTPASRSVTVESAASSDPNITTMPSRPGAM